MRMRTLALPEAVAHWLLTSRVKIGAKIVTHTQPSADVCGAKGIVPGNPTADRRTTTKTGSQEPLVIWRMFVE
jgi:hypothetical protein